MAFVLFFSPLLSHCLTAPSGKWPRHRCCRCRRRGQKAVGCQFHFYLAGNGKISSDFFFVCSTRRSRGSGGEAGGEDEGGGGGGGGLKSEERFPLHRWVSRRPPQRHQTFTVFVQLSGRAVLLQPPHPNHTHTHAHSPPPPAGWEGWEGFGVVGECRVCLEDRCK